MPEILWRPNDQEIANCQMMKFIGFVHQHYHYLAHNFFDLHQWSIQHPDQFWEAIWHFCEIKLSQAPKKIFRPGKHMMEATWFEEAKLNFAENLLPLNNHHLAIIFNNERNERRTFTYAELYNAVAKVASYLRELGIQPHDRIAAVLPNMPEAIIAMLATTSLGAIWSSCSPDFGYEGIFDRFYQIQPKILFVCDGYFYNGKLFSNKEKIIQLRKNISSLKEIILIEYANIPMDHSGPRFNKLLERPDEPLVFEQLPFNHPIYILYSSGTTGMPKGIVHGAGGTILQHMKELRLHTEVNSLHRIFYYTTCGWMMWNWYVSSLAIGATIIQYDGAPFYPTPKRLLDFVDEELITHFGTSAKYIGSLEKSDFHPKQSNNLSSLQTILSTGSALLPKNFDYIYKVIKNDVRLSSISGGTDIISCFALGNPLLPVYRGELQCIGLGMDIKIYDEQGKSVVDQKGELVCVNAFPCMPVYFWNDPKKEKYHQAYFTQYPGVWAHGDFAEISQRHTMIIYGRSDATLNPGGVRIGTAEIYRQVEKIPEVMESLAVSQDYLDDTRIVLFVILKEPLKLSEELCEKIKQTIRQNCSPRHVPAKIIQVPDLPRTLNGKILEITVREIIHQRSIKNISVIANPKILEFFKNLKVS